MKKSKIFKWAIYLILPVLTLAACTPSASTEEMQDAENTPKEAPQESAAAPEPMVFEDDLGNTLEFMEYPKAIISLSPSMTEMLFGIGAGEQVIGRDEQSNYPEEATTVTSVGALWGELPTEAILALNPDLVLAPQTISEEQVSALEELGLQVYWQRNPVTFEDLHGNLRDIARLTGNEETAEALISDLDMRVKAVQDAVTDAVETPTVFYELDGTDPSNPWTTGAGTFIDYVINLAGGINAAEALEGDYAQISSEELIAINPDVILLADAAFGITPESVKERAGWGGMSAAANNAVYPFNPDILSIPGPRLVEGLEEAAKLLHPELFE